ncbi:hypothetical protein Tco_1059164 [Tanacetum coccineum]
MDKVESSAPKRSAVIRFRLPKRRSTRLTLPAPVPTVDKVDEMILQDTLQVSHAEHKSQEEQEVRENVELVKEHLVSIEIEKMVEGSENVIDDSLLPRNDESKILGTRFLLRKSFDTLADHLQEVMIESLPTMVDTHIKEQVKKQVPKQVRDQVPVYVAEGLILERQKTKEEMERMIAKAIIQELDTLVRSYMSGHILHVHPVQSQTPSVPEQQYQLYLAMKADPQLQQHDIAIWLALQMKFESLQVTQTTCRSSVIRPRDLDDPHDDDHPKGENRAKRQNTSEYEAYVSGELSFGQVNENEQGPSTSGNQEQEDDYDF